MAITIEMTIVDEVQLVLNAWGIRTISTEQAIEKIYKIIKKHNFEIEVESCEIKKK